MFGSYSPIIYSDDGTLYGRIEYGAANGTSYIVRIKRLGEQWEDPLIIKTFGNGVSAEDWLLDSLECPIFTILSNSC